MAMERMKIRAMYEEFPFLAKIAKEETVNEVKVSGVPMDFLLVRREMREFMSGDIFWTDETSDEIFLLSKDGHLMGRVGYRQRHHEWRWYRKATKQKWLAYDSIWDNRPVLSSGCGKNFNVFPEETIRDTLSSIILADEDVFFAVVCVPVCYRFLKVNIVIYRPPKIFSLVGWVNEQIRRAREEVKKELDKIDSVT